MQNLRDLGVWIISGLLLAWIHADFLIEYVLVSLVPFLS